jgi:hypothetical protein
MIKLQCSKHPRYKAIVSPKAACEQCIYLYSLVLKIKSERLAVVNEK